MARATKSAAYRRRQEMISAARRAFVARGADETSLDEVIAEVGGSRRNVYAAFGGKAGLIAAVVEEILGEVVDAGAAFSSPEADDLAPRDVLIGVGLKVVGELMRPDVVAVLREMVVLGGSGGEAERFWQNGPDRLRDALRAWLVRQHDANRLFVPDPDAVAATLPDMMRGPLLLERLTGRREAVTEVEIRRQVERAVDLFLAGALEDRPASTSLYPN